MTATTVDTPRDERVRQVGLLRRLLQRPELGSVAGAILVWLIFALWVGSIWTTKATTATYMNAAAPLGILAVAVALLMISGEFDLSIGSMIGMAGMVIAYLSTQAGLNFWLAIIIALAISLVVGFFNGVLVVTTRLPSFIVTLGTLFVIRGLTIALTRTLTGRTQLGGLQEADGFASADLIFGSQFLGSFNVDILWWILLTAVATWVLLRTRIGNWILGTGGAEQSARNVGVPTVKLKIGLFMTTAASAWLVATLFAVRFTGADTLRGTQQEFFAIIAVVIGGTLLTGGYGSAIGAFLGALIFGMVRQGIVVARVDGDWFQVFLGGMVIAAVIFNNFIRKRAQKA
jgi:simple sugar transport system permease protein